MNTMQAAVYERRGVVTVQDRPIPAASAGRVVVEVSHCGICGSDIHVIMEGWGAPGTVEGHEYTGTIVAVGPDVEGWAVGDEIVCGAAPRCGTCEGCRAGRPSQCSNRGGVMGTAGDDESDSGDRADEQTGAYATYTSVDARSLLRLPPGLDLRTAALAEPLAVALHGITRSEIQPGQSSMIFGAGPIGALTLAVLRTMDVGAVCMVEPNGNRQQLARDLGADVVVHPDDLEMFSVVEPDRVADRAVHVVYECSGKKPAMEAGLCQLRRGGRMVMVGAGIEAPTFDGNRILLNELTITGSFIYDADGFERALDLLASGALPTGVLIEPDDIGLDEIGDAMRALARGDLAGKVMVVPGLPGSNERNSA